VGKRPPQRLWGLKRDTTEPGDVSRMSAGFKKDSQREGKTKEPTRTETNKRKTNEPTGAGQTDKKEGGAAS